MRLASSPASWSVIIAPLALSLAAAIGGGCSSDSESLFGGGLGQGGAGGGAGGFGGTSSSSSSTTSSSSSSSASSASSGASGPSSSASSGAGGASSGTGGAGGAVPCLHDLCSSGDPLTLGCDPCVDLVCAQNDACCTDFWGGNCLTLASQLCNKGCCGNGECNGESCDSCPQDCGMCFCGDGTCNGGETCGSCQEDCGPCPTCPHTVCTAGAALSPQLCRDACVDQVCAPAQDPNCCGMGNSAPWNADCANLADMLCGADTCVVAVCMTNPSCCTQSWTQACVDAAKTACSTTCACAHDICVDGDKLDKTCNPCVTSVCKSDPYCCDNSWDGICRGEAELICGVNCP